MLHEVEVFFGGGGEGGGEEFGRAMQAAIVAEIVGGEVGATACLRGRGPSLGRHELFNHAPQLANVLLQSRDAVICGFWQGLPDPHGILRRLPRILLPPCILRRLPASAIKP
mgnify:FL=1